MRDLPPGRPAHRAAQGAETMRWLATHRITYAEPSTPPNVLEVMAMDLGADHPGPGRYALYTSAEWGAERRPDWTLDGEGRLWLKDERLPENVTATVESVWD
jgi:hypothetical protein